MHTAYSTMNWLSVKVQKWLCCFCCRLLVSEWSQQCLLQLLILLVGNCKLCLGKDTHLLKSTRSYALFKERVESVVDAHYVSITTNMLLFNCQKKKICIDFPVLFYLYRYPYSSRQKPKANKITRKEKLVTSVDCKKEYHTPAFMHKIRTA